MAWGWSPVGAKSETSLKSGIAYLFYLTTTVSSIPEQH